MRNATFGININKMRDKQVQVLWFFGCCLLALVSSRYLWASVVHCQEVAPCLTLNNDHLWLMRDDCNQLVGDVTLPARWSPFFYLPVPINRADQELLATLPGIGPKMAARIIAHRQHHGKIGSAADLLLIQGIGPHKAAQLENHISYQ